MADRLLLPPVTDSREGSQDSARGKCQQTALPRLDDCKVGLVSILSESGFTGLKDEQDWILGRVVKLLRHSGGSRNPRVSECKSFCGIEPFWIPASAGESVLFVKVWVKGMG